MAYNNYKKSDVPTRPKKVGTLWKPKIQGGEAVLEGYLDLGMDASIKIAVVKAVKRSDKSPDYVINATVKDWGGSQQQVKSEKAGGADEDVPF